MHVVKPYSIDLRERVVANIVKGHATIPATAKRFKVSQPSVERWVARFRATGSCAALPHAGGKLRTLAPAEAVIRAVVKDQPDATLPELCELVERKTKLQSDAPMMCRELARLKLRRKKRRSMPVNGTRRASNGAGGPFGSTSPRRT